MTREELRKNDTEFYTEKIAEVQKGHDGYTLSLDNGFRYFCGFSEDDTKPEVGDIAKFYGRRYQPVRGLVLIRGEREHLIFYRTGQEQKRKDEKIWDDHKQKMLRGHRDIIQKIKDEPERRTVDISGFGGEYEYQCQRMLEAGKKWLSSHPRVELSFEELKGVTGVISPGNSQAKVLYDYVLDAISGDCSGAQAHAVMHHLVSISRKGVDGWIESTEEDRIYTFPNIPEPEFGD